VDTVFAYNWQREIFTGSDRAKLRPFALEVAPHGALQTIETNQNEQRASDDGGELCRHL
jgi:hypothetical protein